MKRFLALVGLAFLGLGVPSVSQGQEPDREQVRNAVEQQLGRGVSQAELLDRLRQSGMTREQVRSRLSDAGYDPGMADQYFDVMEQGGEPPQGEASEEFVGALQDIGVSAQDSVRPDSVPADSIAGDSLGADAAPGDTLAREAPGIFGRALFARATEQFRPVTTGPVDSGYRIGPGDEISLILTGDVELAYSLPVTREGAVVIPDVGRIAVNGLTLRQLEDRLYSRLGQAYSGVERGAEATTHFQVSLGALRTNQVYVIGDVERPSAYQVSAAATVFNALYRAGGPTEDGSFRRVQVRRGGEAVRTVDIYDYLVRGDSGDDIRLQQGDIIFVPPAGPQVEIRGAVRRPLIYELAEGEGLRDLVEYAAGFEAEAFIRRVQIDRILPPDERRSGIDRVLVDVDVERLLDRGGEFIPIREGDVVQVFAVLEERRHRLAITGEVLRPGVYEWSEGTTLWELIEHAQGLDEQAYTPRAHIYRLNRTEGTRRLIRTPLLADSTGRPTRDVPLADRDSVVVYSRGELRNAEQVTIDGFVKEPGTYTLAEGMTLEDLILAAGGFVHGAYVSQAEVARLPAVMQRTDTTAHVVHVPLDGTVAERSRGEAPDSDRATGAIGAADDTARALSPAALRYGERGGNDGLDARSPDVPMWVPDAQELELRHGDQVFVRKAPGYEAMRTVTLTGEVMLPGTYVLRSRQERVSELLQRAGGLSEEAYAPGGRLVRGGELVGMALEDALERPGGREDVLLEAGDTLHVPELDPTVLVRGAVAFEARALYRPGEGLDYYVDQAGGYLDAAAEDRVSVLYPNGARATIDEFLFFDFKPDVLPGSTVFVPQAPPGERGGVDWDRWLTRSVSILSTTLTLLITVDQLGDRLK